MLQAVDVSCKGQHLPRGARAVMFLPRDGARAYEIRGRAPKRLELRQSDLDPAMGGHGWTEHCPKCTRARRFGWKK